MHDNKVGLYERRQNSIAVPNIDVKAMSINDSASQEGSSVNTIMAKTKKSGKASKKFPI